MQSIDEILEAAEKATPGPWEQSHRENGDGMFRTQVYTPDGNTICNLSWYPMPKVDGAIGTYRPHNARLIAGAPQLAAEVRRLRERENVLEEALSSCVEIRRKVESIERGEEWTGGEPTLGTCRLLGEIKRASDQARAALSSSPAAPHA